MALRLRPEEQSQGRDRESRVFAAKRTDWLPKVPVVSIIDDDMSVRVATSRLVRSHGYQALAFASAEDFLKSKHLDDTCCVITDVQMPGTTGIELQRWLRDHGRSLPMIFITAFPEETIRARALEGGAVGFF